jgi:hypothetical protein
MKRACLSIVTAASMVATAAAQAGPSMAFTSVPAVPATQSVRHAVMQSRAGERMVVVVKEPAACGARPTEPRFALDDGVLRVGFRLPAAAARTCVATAVFTMKGLPPEPVAVLADAQHAAAAPARAEREPGLALTFIGGEARPVAGIAQPVVRQLRSGGQLVAVVTQPAACGSRLSDAAVALDETNLALRYRAAASGGQAPSCAATAVFTVRGLPSRKLIAVAQPALSDRGGHLASVADSTAKATPTMRFMATPAIRASAFGALQNVVQVRSGDAMNVVIHEPAACGDRPERASFKLEGGLLRLHYQMPNTRTSETGCVATVMAAFRGLPADDIRVVAASGSAPGGTLAMDRAQANSH